MGDMLVKLYDLPEPSGKEALLAKGVVIKQALVPDKAAILEFVAKSFETPGWIAECETALLRLPTTCFIAVHGQQVVGFACYDATAKGMAGPIGVHTDFRGQGIASELLLHCLTAMRYAGYAYAVIGWVGSEGFYEKVCGALAIPGSAPGVYSRLVSPP